MRTRWLLAACLLAALLLLFRIGEVPSAAANAEAPAPAPPGKPVVIRCEEPRSETCRQQCADRGFHCNTVASHPRPKSSQSMGGLVWCEGPFGGWGAKRWSCAYQFNNGDLCSFTQPGNEWHCKSD